MISFWVGYGSNYIGGTGEGQSNLAWRLPSIIQGIPAVCLAVGIWFMPFSPRWLVKMGRDDEAKNTLAWLRKLPIDHDELDAEYLEIKAEALFEQKAFARDFPDLAEQRQSRFKHQLVQYRMCFRSMDNFKRICIAWLVMFWQQWSGIDAIIYYASNVFVSLGLTGGTNALLATGVTGVVFLVSTVPAMVSLEFATLRVRILIRQTANHRPSRSQTNVASRLCRYGCMYGDRWCHSRQIQPRLARSRGRWLDCSRSHLGLYCWLWSNMGSCILDARF